MSAEIITSGLIPQRSDTIRLLLVKEVLAGGSGGGTSGGNGSPVGVITPTSSHAFYIQDDSTPPGLIWEWFGGAWH